MQQIIASGVFRHGLQRAVAVAHFAHGGGARVFIKKRAESFEKQYVFGLRFIVNMLLIAVGVHLRRVDPGAFGRGRRVVGEGRAMDIEVYRIKAKAIDATVQPEAHSVEQGVLHIHVVEI